MEINHFDREIEDELARIREAHAKWFAAWLRAGFCQIPLTVNGREAECCAAFRRLSGLFRMLDGHAPQLAVMQAHADLHQWGDRLQAQRAEQPLAPAEYEAFVRTNDQFDAQIREVCANFGVEGAAILPAGDLQRRLTEEHQRILRSRNAAMLAKVWIEGLPDVTGQQVLARVVGWVAHALRPYDLVFVLPDHQFLICVAGVDTALLRTILGRLQETLASLASHDGMTENAELALRYASCELDPSLTLEQCLRQLSRQQAHGSVAR